MLITNLISLWSDKSWPHLGHAVRKIQYGFLTLSGLSILNACSSTSVETEVKDNVGEQVNTSTSEMYVAFAGGGWRAHTGHAAWIIALLNNEPNQTQTTLDDAFTHVRGISSNSGGSWFNTMLSYSDNFRKVLENPAAKTDYLTDRAGYYQQEKYILNHPTKTSKSLLCDAAGVFSNDLAIACETDLNWHSLVEDIVFAPLTMKAELKNITLSDPQAWQNPKAISMAATALTQEVVLTSSDFGDKYFYDTANLGLLNIAPVAFSSKISCSPPSGKTLCSSPLKFFPGGAGKFDVIYKDTGLILPDPSGTILKTGNHRDLESSGIDVISAAAASSAAVGYMSSRRINEKNNSVLSYIPLSDWDISYHAENLAVLFNLPNPSASQQKLSRLNIPPIDNSYTNANAGYIKIADGGPLDNSGVAHSVMYHQKSSSASKPFEIIAFDNVQKTFPLTTKSSFTDVGIDIANLFGQGLSPIPNTSDKEMCADGYCVTTDNGIVSPTIFESPAVAVGKGWSWTSRIGGNTPPCVLLYMPYSVRTVDNTMLGIKGGHSGLLHSFTARCPEAKTAPSTAADWAAYDEMFKAIQKGMTEYDGLKHLRAAFKLP